MAPSAIDEVQSSAQKLSNGGKTPIAVLPPETFAVSPASPSSFLFNNASAATVSSIGRKQDFPPASQNFAQLYRLSMQESQARSTFAKLDTQTLGWPGVDPVGQDPEIMTNAFPGTSSSSLRSGSSLAQFSDSSPSPYSPPLFASTGSSASKVSQAHPSIADRIHVPRYLKVGTTSLDDKEGVLQTSIKKQIRFQERKMRERECSETKEYLRQMHVAGKSFVDMSIMVATRLPSLKNQQALEFMLDAVRLPRNSEEIHLDQDSRSSNRDEFGDEDRMEEKEMCSGQHSQISNGGEPGDEGSTKENDNEDNSKRGFTKQQHPSKRDRVSSESDMNSHILQTAQTASTGQTSALGDDHLITPPSVEVATADNERIANGRRPETIEIETVENAANHSALADGCCGPGFCSIPLRVEIADDEEVNEGVDALDSAAESYINEDEHDQSKEIPINCNELHVPAVEDTTKSIINDDTIQAAPLPATNIHAKVASKGESPPIFNWSDEPEELNLKTRSSPATKDEPSLEARSSPVVSDDGANMFSSSPMRNGLDGDILDDISPPMSDVDNCREETFSGGLVPLSAVQHDKPLDSSSTIEPMQLDDGNSITEAIAAPNVDDTVARNHGYLREVMESKCERLSREEVTESYDQPLIKVLDTGDTVPFEAGILKQQDTEQDLTGVSFPELKPFSPLELLGRLAKERHQEDSASVNALNIFERCLNNLKVTEMDKVSAVTTCLSKVVMLHGETMSIKEDDRIRTRACLADIKKYVPAARTRLERSLKSNQATETDKTRNAILDAFLEGLDHVLKEGEIAAKQATKRATRNKKAKRQNKKGKSKPETIGSVCFRCQSKHHCPGSISWKTARLPAIYAKVVRASYEGVLATYGRAGGLIPLYRAIRVSAPTLLSSLGLKADPVLGDLASGMDLLPHRDLNTDGNSKSYTCCEQAGTSSENPSEGRKHALELMCYAQHIAECIYCLAPSLIWGGEMSENSIYHKANKIFQTCEQTLAWYDNMLQIWISTHMNWELQIKASDATELDNFCKIGRFMEKLSEAFIKANMMPYRDLRAAQKAVESTLTIDVADKYPRNFSELCQRSDIMDLVATSVSLDRRKWADGSIELGSRDVVTKEYDFNDDIELRYWHETCRLHDVAEAQPWGTVLMKSAVMMPEKPDSYEKLKSFAIRLYLHEKRCLELYGNFTDGWYQRKGIMGREPCGELPIAVPCLFTGFPDSASVRGVPIHDLGRVLSFRQIFESATRDLSELTSFWPSKMLLNHYSLIGQRLGCFFAKLHKPVKPRWLAGDDELLGREWLRANRVVPLKERLHGFGGDESVAITLAQRAEDDYDSNNGTELEVMALNNASLNSVLIQQPVWYDSVVAVVNWERAGKGRGFSGDMAQLLAELICYQLDRAQQNGLYSLALRAFTCGLTTAYRKQKLADGSRLVMSEGWKASHYGLEKNKSIPPKVLKVVRSTIISTGREIIHFAFKFHPPCAACYTERTDACNFFFSRFRLGLEYLQVAEENEEEFMNKSWNNVILSDLDRWPSLLLFFEPEGELPMSWEEFFAASGNPGTNSDSSGRRSIGDRV